MTPSTAPVISSPHSFRVLAMEGSSCGSLDFSCDYGTHIAHGDRKVVLCLQVDRKLRVIAKIPTETQRSLSADRTFGVEDVHDATGRNAQCARKRIRRKISGVKLSPQNTAWMSRNHANPQ